MHKVVNYMWNKEELAAAKGIFHSTHL